MDQRIRIAELNIEHFRKRLQEETDEEVGQQICALLAEEENKLAKLNGFRLPERKPRS